MKNSKKINNAKSKMLNEAYLDPSERNLASIRRSFNASGIEPRYEFDMPAHRIVDDDDDSHEDDFDFYDDPEYSEYRRNGGLLEYSYWKNRNAYESADADESKDAADSIDEELNSSLTSFVKKGGTAINVLFKSIKNTIKNPSVKVGDFLESLNIDSLKLLHEFIKNSDNEEVKNLLSAIEYVLIHRDDDDVVTEWGARRFYYGDTTCTKNGFTPAKRADGSQAIYKDSTGHTGPIMLGVTEYGVKGWGPEDYPLIENNLPKKSKAPVHLIIWLADYFGPGKGLNVNMTKYQAATDDPRHHQEDIATLESYGIPLDINTRS